MQSDQASQINCNKTCLSHSAFNNYRQNRENVVM